MKTISQEVTISILVNNVGFGLVDGTESIDFNLDKKP